MATSGYALLVLHIYIVILHVLFEDTPTCVLCTAITYAPCISPPPHCLGLAFTDIGLLLGKMESCEARFVAMFMDRLQDLETQVTTLQGQNVTLTEELAAMQRTLHLKDDLFTFSDGYRLFLSFDDSNSTMESPDACCMKSFTELPLDAVHANATAWYGKMKSDLSCCDVGQTVTVGGVHKRVTVTEFADAIQSWAVAWNERQTHPAIDASSMIYDYTGYQGWSIGHCDRQDHATVCALK